MQTPLSKKQLLQAARHSIREWFQHRDEYISQMNEMRSQDRAICQQFDISSPRPPELEEQLRILRQASSELYNQFHEFESKGAAMRWQTIGQDLLSHAGDDPNLQNAAHIARIAAKMMTRYRLEPHHKLTYAMQVIYDTLRQAADGFLTPPLRPVDELGVEADQIIPNLIFSNGMVTVGQVVTFYQQSRTRAYGIHTKHEEQLVKALNLYLKGEANLFRSYPLLEEEDDER